MKTFVKMLMCLACMAWLSSCEKDSDINGTKHREVSKVFDASFNVYDLTEGEPVITNDGCFKNWKGEGESLILERFSVDITLFCDMENLSFCDLNGTFFAQDGSELYFSIAQGKIICIQDQGCEIFHYSIDDVATIEGGTKRFQGATGSFNPEVKIHNRQIPDWFAQFSCNGLVNLKWVGQQSPDASDPLHIPDPKEPEQLPWLGD